MHFYVLPNYFVPAAVRLAARPTQPLGLALMLAEEEGGRSKKKKKKKQEEEEGSQLSLESRDPHLAGGKKPSKHNKTIQNHIAAKSPCAQ